jgi:hypothetical protein
MNIPGRETARTIGLVLEQYWFVKEPSLDLLKSNFNATISEIVFEKIISHDVSIRARIDGLVELELGGLPNCQRTKVPEVIVGPGEELPGEYLKQEKIAYCSIVSRLKYVNAFKACISSSMYHVQSHSIPSDPPVLPSNYMPLFAGEFQSVLYPMGRSENDKKLEQNNVAKNMANKNQLQKRILFKMETLEYAALLFEEIIKRGEGFALLVDLLYHQNYLYSSHRFSECLIGAWTIIEAGISKVWEQYIDNYKHSGGQVSKGRMKKLQGRDFTASIVQEVLSLSSVFAHSEYDEVDRIRKARNKWMHDLLPVSSDDAAKALQLSHKMVLKAYGIEIGMPISCGYIL